MQSQAILHFWFEELTPAQHFAQDKALDAQIAECFGNTLDAARKGELWAWRATPQGRLAEILVLDQFSRNIHRGKSQAFAQDAMALALAQELVAGRHDSLLTPAQRAFAYMPYMHSESPMIHTQAMALFGQPGLEKHLRIEILHKDIIARFGRYPHRNAALGRHSTTEEAAFLQQHGSSF